MRTGAVSTTSVIRFDEIDSTNADARRRAEAGEAGPLWLIAGRQTSGRGRRGRAWETGPGNLAATLLTSTSKPPAEAAQIAFVAALAVADLALAHVPSALVSLKWPNDMLVAGRKASGVLIESGQRPDRRSWLAIGVGVNLASPPLAAERPATCLADHLGARASVMSPGEALAYLSEAFDRRLNAWEMHGFEPVRQAWTERAYGLGRPCLVQLDRECVEGVAEGLEASGALRLRLDSGEVRHIAAGDVFFGGG